MFVNFLMLVSTFGKFYNGNELYWLLKDVLQIFGKFPNPAALEGSAELFANGEKRKGGLF